MSSDGLQHQHTGQSGSPQQFLAFNLGDEEYAIDIRQVQELRGVGQDSQIKPAPVFDGDVAGDYLPGLGTIDERMLILMNLDRLLSDTEFTNNSTLH